MDEQHRVQISQITIQNFKSIRDSVKLGGIKQCNRTIRLSYQIQKDLQFAIFYGIGAGANEIQVSNMSDVRNSDENVSHVQLVLSLPDRTQVVIKRETWDRNEEKFFVDNEELSDLKAYKMRLMSFGINMDSQFIFFDAQNRRYFWSITRAIQDELIFRLADSPNDFRIFLALTNKIKRFKMQLKTERKKLQTLRRKVSQLKLLVPKHPRDWLTTFRKQILLRLSCDEIKRRASITKLRASRDELPRLRDRIDEQQLLTQNAETILGALTREKNNYLLELQTHLLEPFADESVHSLKLKVHLFKETIHGQMMHIKDAESILQGLQNLKVVTESNLTSNQSAISEDTLQKANQIVDSCNELKLDELTLTLIEKEETLNKIDNSNKATEFYENLLPKKVPNPSALQNAASVCSELLCATKRIVDPHAMIYKEYDLFHIIHELIPKEKGFMLTSFFKPESEEYKSMIDSVLRNHKLTVVLYEKDKQRIYKMLAKRDKFMFRSVKFMLLKKLKKPNPNFQLQPNHWLNYCRGIGIQDKLVQHMATMLNILRVETQDEVRDAYQQRTKKYVVASDGQLIYTRYLGLDRLEYVKPGKKSEKFATPDAVSKLLEAENKLSEVSENFLKRMTVPSTTIVNTADNLRSEVDSIKVQLNDLQQRRTNQLETLRMRLNTLCTPQDPTVMNRLQMERRNLIQDIDSRISQIQAKIDKYLRDNEKITETIKQIERCTGIKIAIKDIETNCTVQSKITKENTSLIEENSKRSDELHNTILRLEAKLEELKHSSLKTVLYAKMNLDREDFLSLFTGEVYNRIDRQEYIDSETIQFDITYRNPKTKLRKIGPVEIYSVITEDRASINDVKADIKNIKIHIGRLRKNLKIVKLNVTTACINFNAAISNNIQSLLNELQLEFKYQIEFCYNFGTNTKDKQMIVVRDNGNLIPLESLSVADHRLVQWIVFAAFHTYSGAPFLQLDFYDDIDITPTIGRILKRISESSQIFCNTSQQHVAFCSFVDLQIAADQKPDEPDITLSTSFTYDEEVQYQ